MCLATVALEAPISPMISRRLGVSPVWVAEIHQGDRDRVDQEEHLNKNHGPDDNER